MRVGGALRSPRVEFDESAEGMDLASPGESIGVDGFAAELLIAVQEAICEPGADYARSVAFENANQSPTEPLAAL